MLYGVGGRVSIAPFPVAWGVERAHDDRFPGDEYVRCVSLDLFQLVWTWPLRLFQLFLG